MKAVLPLGILLSTMTSFTLADQSVSKLLEPVIKLEESQMDSITAAGDDYHVSHSSSFHTYDATNGTVIRRAQVIENGKIIQDDKVVNGVLSPPEQIDKIDITPTKRIDKIRENIAKIRANRLRLAEKVRQDMAKARTANLRFANANANANANKIRQDMAEIIAERFAESINQRHAKKNLRF